MKNTHNPIRAAALVVVAVLSTFIMWMDWRSSNILSSPTWCARAIGADKADPNSHVDAASSCVGLLTLQLKAVATDSHIRAGVEAFALLVVVVLVIAGGKLSFKGSKEGIEGNMSSADDAAAAGAAQTAGAAVDKANEIATEGVKP